ncbi:protein kinase domain-containing protein [Streptomyces galbus]|uniref:Serine/threonine protein kinase n=1 Tax=Streptomyces galbus TaxID=33898 RepID=A0A4U5X3J4_STRGB|nr:serine/threonine-protein kinase [Streptomyces galbus]TKT09350.1 serine/threonine protein kinase [Streptomyces galbus]GHD28863.1 serine/threonine protein kinase [Streptomyces galbus]
MPAHRDDPKSVGGYRIVGRLGSGGMGVVYRGRARSGREVAVKVVHSQYAEDGVFRIRFRQEIEAVRKVSGAFTAPVVDADPEAARPWMATQYVPGPSLADHIRAHGPLRGTALRRLALGLLEALRDIHRAGVVHRDLKPANVLIADDGPRVIDFGISRAAGNQTLTETGHMIGTPPFMSPEQLTDARSAGPASDVFSLGSLLVYAATGRGPFDADSPYLTAYQVLTAEPDLTGLPEPLRAVLAGCLAKEADDRPALDDLAGRLAEALPTSAPDDDPTVALRRPDPEPTAPDPAGSRAGGPVAADAQAESPAPDAHAEPQAPVPAPPRRPRRRARLLALSAGAAVLATALTAYLLSRPDGGTAGPDAGRSPSAGARWEPPPTGWRPWRTTVFAEAASGVRTATRGSTGGLSCATAGGALYCAGDGVLPVRFDTLTGKVLWRSAAGVSGAAGARYEHQVLGVAGPVLLVRQSVLAEFESGRTASVVALDTRTGARVWSRALVRGSEAAPALAAGLALVPDVGGRTVTARSPRDGARLWSATLPAGHSCAFPASAGGLYAVCSSYAGAGADTRLLRVDPADGAVRALATLEPRSTYLGVVDGRHVFAEESGSGESDLDETAYGRVVLVDGTTGERRTVPLAGTPRGLVTLAGGLLCFTRSNGLVTAHAPATGARLWQSRTTLEQGGVTVADGKGRTLFVASVSGRVAALDSREGTVLWESYPRAGGTDNGFGSQIHREGGALTVTTADGTVFALDPAHPDRTPS